MFWLVLKLSMIRFKTTTSDSFFGLYNQVFDPNHFLDRARNEINRQGMNAVSVVRKITGGTEPLTADIGTIRGDFTIDSYQISDIDGRAARNLVHTSGSAKEAKMEINLWFKDKEIFNYRLVNEEILYDVNLDGILE